MPTGLLDGEDRWVAAVVADLADDATKLVYADWLEERDDPRGGFVQAARSMDLADFPDAAGLPEAWLELIGFRLLEQIAAAGTLTLKGPALRLARPALRMVELGMEDGDISVGASKLGGLPDLPSGYRWPAGEDCRATFWGPVCAHDPAGFLGQINLTEVAQTQAGKDLPDAGLLSFFCHLEAEKDASVGVRAVFFPDAAGLVRTPPPGELTEFNATMPSRRLDFEETLDLPEDYCGPWSEELRPPEGEDYSEVFEYFRERNFDNVLGYARATTGDDPTPTKDFRHLIVLTNVNRLRLQIQISS